MLIGIAIIVFSMMATGVIGVFVLLGGDWNNLFYEERPRVPFDVESLCAVHMTRGGGV